MARLSKNHDKDKIVFLNSVETGEFNTKKGDIDEKRAKNAYSKIIQEVEHDRVHVLTIKRVTENNSVITLSEVRKTTTSEWENETDFTGEIIKQGLSKQLTKEGKTFIVLWHPDIDKPAKKTPPAPVSPVSPKEEKEEVKKD